MLSVPKFLALQFSPHRKSAMERWLVATIKGQRNTLTFFSMEKKSKGEMTGKINIVNWRSYLQLFITEQLIEPN